MEFLAGTTTRTTQDDLDLASHHSEADPVQDFLVVEEEMHVAELNCGGSEILIIVLDRALFHGFC